MAQREIKLFLIKVVPLFLLTLLIWQRFGVSHYYHAIAAAALTALRAIADPTGLVSGISAEESNFVVSLFYRGQTRTLEITAEDITSNTAMLIALFLASPIRLFLKPYVLLALASLVSLLIIHIFTLATTIQYALMETPMVTQVHDFSPHAITFCNFYTVFYERFGMFLFVLALWFPYILYVIIRSKRVENE